MIAAFFGKIGAKIAAFVAVVSAALLLLWGFGRSKKEEGRKDVLHKQKEKEVQDVQKRKEIQKDVRDDSRDELDKRLSDYYRD